MANSDMLLRLVSQLGSLVAETAHEVISHPVDTAANALSSAAGFVQANPYTCALVIGVGAYTHHRGWWKVNGNRLQVNLDCDVGILGAFRTNSTLRLGPR